MATKQHQDIVIDKQRSEDAETMALAYDTTLSDIIDKALVLWLATTKNVGLLADIAAVKATAAAP